MENLKITKNSSLLEESKAISIFKRLYKAILICGYLISLYSLLVLFFWVKEEIDAIWMYSVIIMNGVVFFIIISFLMIYSIFLMVRKIINFIKGV